MIPRARQNGILVHHVDDEVVVYDKSRCEAHRLNRTASKVWNLIDGARSVAQIAAALDVDESVVSLSIDELAKVQLLEAGEELSVTRRAIVRRMAAAAAVGFMLPAISSIVAPTPAQAESGRPVPQDPSGQGGGGGRGPQQEPISTTYPRRGRFRPVIRRSGS